MKKILILVLVTFFICSCDEEEATEPVNKIQYSLEELENDANWVEVKDYELLEIPCLKVFDLEEKYYLKNDEDYQELSNHFYNYSSCTLSTLPEVDFDEEELIGVSYFDYPLKEYDEFQIKVFKNSIEKKIIVYCEIEYDTVQLRNKIGYMYRKWIKKSRNSQNNELKFIYNSNL